MIGSELQQIGQDRKTAVYQFKCLSIVKNLFKGTCSHCQEHRSHSPVPLREMKSASLKSLKKKSILRKRRTSALATDLGLPRFSEKYGNEIIRISTQSNFFLTVYQEEIKESCKVITRERYEIGLEIQTTPKESMFVTMASPDQTISTLKTQLQLVGDHKLRVVSIVRKLHGASHAANGTEERRAAGEFQNTDEHEGVHLSLDSSLTRVLQKLTHRGCG